MRHGLIKVAAGTPRIRVGDCGYNAKEIVGVMRAAREAGSSVLVLGELSVTGYTAGDLFLQDTLIDAAENALADILAASADMDMLVAVGLPVRYKGKLLNCAAVLHKGWLLGIVPKTHLPNYGEFYESRQFVPAPTAAGEVRLAGQDAPLSNRLLFPCETVTGLTVGVEICEDLWVAEPCSTRLALDGATVVLNLSASNELVGKAAYRRELVKSQSARLNCAYVYANAGYGESTSDLVFGGHNIIAENGVILAESEPFMEDAPLVITEVDVQHMLYERRRMNTFPMEGEAKSTVSFALALTDTVLTRPLPALPFVPQDEAERDARCESILQMQAQGLRKRLAHIGGAKAVLGISGGLDSTLALLIAVRAMLLLGKPASEVEAVTMPCFGTTDRTRNNALLLCELLSVPCRTVDISAAVTQHFRDIGHPADQYDTTFENAQARERTQVLMDIANQVGGIVIGTGDLSELALGWATYNGDHMSMYAVNASVPKTLVRHLVRYAADTADTDELREVLLHILDTPVSPELLPAENGAIAQKTENIVGPYELHDFFLYHMLRWGEGPEKIYRLAQAAFAGEYRNEEILRWLRVFIRRFFSQQFKRSCMPDGPKIGSVSLSPRGDWRMPSDAEAAAWLQELANLDEPASEI